MSLSKNMFFNLNWNTARWLQTASNELCGSKW